MPSRSPKQKKFMDAIAHGWRPSGMKNPPSMSVAQDFVNADKAVGNVGGGRNFGRFPKKGASDPYGRPS